MKPWSEHMLIGECECAITVGTFDRDGRREAAGIGEWIETRKVRVEERGVYGVLLREPPIKFQSELVLRVTPPERHYADE